MIKLVQGVTKLVPAPLAAKGLYAIGSISRRSAKLKPHDVEALARAERFTFCNEKRVGYRWGQGPMVVLIHGWESRAAQMAPLAQHLAAQGFGVAAVDLKGHGESAGKQVSFSGMQDDIVQLTEFLDQPIHAFVGHSAGGLVMMAARYQKQIEAKHYAVIAAPRGPYPPIDAMNKVLNLGENLEHACKSIIAKQFSIPWDELISGKVYQYSGQGQFLAIYDTSDKVVSYSDGEVVKSQWPGAEYMQTSELGHNGVMRSPEVLNRIGTFLQSA